MGAPTDSAFNLDEQISQLMQCKPLSEQQSVLDSLAVELEASKDFSKLYAGIAILWLHLSLNQPSVEFAGSSMETTSNSTFGLMYLDGMLLRFLDASAWTFSTGKEPNISVLTTFVSIAVKLSQVKHYAQIIMLMNELLKVYNTTKSFLSFA
ncbi:hypothetical protein ES332_A12G240900v1 [Gossypium tomentosum]|uniref:Uncharacterized protein n=1 Tax=Gossypium tomentosum TaxID=34277 RepID=A0A5D2N1N1_GOSTO|nr:hypothetical protein ES332_A12G240900v1 [Gossypium tomentosum]